jgi:leucyl-tRNA synthetase
VWNDTGVEGAFKFLKRLWRFVHEHVEAGVIAHPLTVNGVDNRELRNLRRRLHQTIAKVADDYGRRLQYNTAIAAVMELINALVKMETKNADARALMQEACEAVVLMLSPVVPHICDSLWRSLRPGTELGNQLWPKVDEAALVAEEVKYMIQVNGKLRSEIVVPLGTDSATLEKLALADEQVARFIAGKPIKKCVVVPGRLINLVV